MADDSKGRWLAIAVCTVMIVGMASTGNAGILGRLQLPTGGCIEMDGIDLSGLSPDALARAPLHDPPVLLADGRIREDRVV